MKIGDKVRFLSETGGGTVAGFQGKNIVLVEDEDGFQIPTPINDVVLVGQDDYSTAKVIERHDKAVKAAQTAGTAEHDSRSIKAMLKEGYDDKESGEEEHNDPAEKEVTFHKKEEQRTGGNQLAACLAFVPDDSNDVANTTFQMFMVNDCNYSMYYTIATAEGNSYVMRYSGVVEANTKLQLDTLSHTELDTLSRIAVQLLAFKQDANYLLKAPVNVELRLEAVRFYKLHAFRENLFFDTPALLVDIVKNDVPARGINIDAQQLKQQMYKPARKEPAKSTDTYVRRYDDGKSKGNPLVIKHRGDDDIVVIDLHADQLLETTIGMSPADILNYQLKKFREVLDSYKDKKGQKIVFIHGKGQGVLRTALINDLRYRYRNYPYQDASFQEYGYGATQVTIK